MIVFEEVEKNVLKNFNLEVKKGEIFVLLGQSGSGKTTLLRLVNRLIEPDAGRIIFNGIDLNTLNPIEHRRHIGYAIQHIGLFPHMTVGENVAVVPELLGWSEKAITDRVDELLEMVCLNEEGFAKFYPHTLSGGQKQRVGVARALAADPPVILMDEPFGALDPLIREQLQNEFLDIQSKIQKTVVFVTHDLSEAMKMGDRIGILQDGCLVQVGTPEEILENPADHFVEAFIGKDRLQLLLRTQTMRSFSNHLNPKLNVGPRLDMSATVLEALMTIRKSDQDAIAIYDADTFKGQLPKNYLIERLVETL